MDATNLILTTPLSCGLRCRVAGLGLIRLAGVAAVLRLFTAAYDCVGLYQTAYI